MDTTAPLRQISRYEVLGELGSGAMGVVYKARDPLIDRLVALKTVGVEQSGSDALAFRQRFFREARSAGGLNHPNIVTIHDVGESGDVAYIAMEFLGGKSLREILDSGTVLPIARIADIAAQIADGLAFAHRKGIIHRDIKPANVMVLDDGTVKITDFGIALMPTGTRTMAGTVFGSPKYISPERVRGDQVDGRSDIFSLGAVLYEMLTGLPPFTGADLNSLLYQILSVMPVAPSSRNRNIPPAFDFIVATALAKNPADRYRNAQDMAADLRNFADLGPREPLPGSVPDPADPEALSARDGAPVVVLSEAYPATLPETMVPMLEDPQPPPPKLAPGWRRTALLSIPAVLLALIAVATLWPRGTTTDPSASPSAVAATQVVPGRSGDGEAAKISMMAPLPPPLPQPSAATAATAPTSAAAAAAPPASGTPAVTAAAVAPPVSVPSIATPATAPAAAAPATVAAPGAIETRAAKADAPAAAKTSAVLGFAVAPWGEVYVNGKKVGIAPPMTEIKLAPGKYVVEIRNTTFPAYRETIDLLTQGSFRIRHKFQ